MILTLWGAYHLFRSPLDQRRISLSVDFRPLELATGRLGLRAVVDAEGLAERAPARAVFGLCGLGFECRVAFSADDGSAYGLDLVKRVEGATLRALSELTGVLVDGKGSVLGTACLRLDYRRLFDFSRQ